MKIAEIKEILAGAPTEEQLAELSRDPRAGVQKLFAAYRRRQECEAAERVRYAQMLAYEREYRKRGRRVIVGMDEAGRGPLAGPLVIAAVILPEQNFIAGLNDSKKLSPQKRAALLPEILAQADAALVNVVSVYHIDALNIYRATQKGMEALLRRLQALGCAPETALVDAMRPCVPGIESVPIIHGDALSASIAAASVVAKETRDEIMRGYAQHFPEYGFEAHKGYGSKQHMEAIARYGASAIHRRSYEPIRSLRLPPAAVEPNAIYDPRDLNGIRFEYWEHCDA